MNSKTSGIVVPSTESQRPLWKGDEQVKKGTGHPLALALWWKTILKCGRINRSTPQDEEYNEKHYMSYSLRGLANHEMYTVFRDVQTILAD